MFAAKMHVRIWNLILATLLTAGMVISMLPQAVVAQGTDPVITQVQIILYTKANGEGETEVNYYLRWTETAPRNQIDMILDAWGGDFGYADVTVYSEGERRFNVRDVDNGSASDSGAFHSHTIMFGETTKVGGDYELAIGYGSRLITFPYGAADGQAEFNWTANPWPFPVQRYEIDWVAEKMPSNEFSSIIGNFSDWDVSEQRTPPSAYPPNAVALRLVKNNAPSGWTPVVGFKVPAQYFGMSSSVVSTEEPQTAPAQPTTQKKGGLGLLGTIILIIILGCVVIGGIWLWKASGKKRREDKEDVLPDEPTAYERPTIKREAGHSEPRVRIANDLTKAEVAYIMGAKNSVIILECVHELAERGLFVVLENDPLTIKVRSRKLQEAVTAGEITRVDKAVIEAVTNDGIIDARETEVIVAAVRASAEMKLAERNADKQATRDYYEERIRHLERQVREQSQPTVYLERNNDIWFWLWLTDRYRYDSDPTPGTYRYPRPAGSVYVNPDGNRQPLTDETFRQSLAHFEKPREGLAAGITDAAARVASTITGAAAGTPVTSRPKPHDACVVSAPHDACVTRPTPHDACVKHDACVSHSNCVTRPHDACVHSNCVSHSACVHSNCVSHSACVSRPR